MKGFVSLFSLCFVLFVSPGFSQDTTSQAKKQKSSWFTQACFAGKTAGELNISEHLEDSLSFTDETANYHERVKSFNLTVMCNGVALLYLENKSGNRLTAEMKEKALKFHPGCILVFDAIRVQGISKEFKGMPDYNCGHALRFTLK